MRTQWLQKNWFLALMAVLFICGLTVTAQAQNLVKGNNMEDESAWNITYYSADSTPFYEFNYTADQQRFGRGGNLHIVQEESNGQLLIWQRIKLIAGETYRASAAIKALNYMPGPAGGGAWYQLYVNPEVPPETGDYNPGAIKLFNMDGWQADFPAEFDGLWEVINLGGGVPSAPYYVPEGTPGEVVEVTFGIKFGQYWADYAGTGFELVVDELGLYALGSNELIGGGMEEEDGWIVQYYNADSQPAYEFGFVPDPAIKYGLGKCLQIFLDNSAGGQLLLYQRVTCIAGETYRATGVINVREFYADFEPVSQGPWYQFYVTTEEPPTEGDFNPGGAKMFDISAWDTGCSMADFEQFQGIWEDVACLSEIEGAPYFVAPGNPGETVEVTVGIKFGLWAPTPGTFEVLVDEVGFYRWNTSASSAVDDKTNPVVPNDFVLDQNYPNPFNPTTTISFNLPKSDVTSVKVYNTTGALVATLVDGQMEAGRHEVSLTMNDLPSGVYYYQLQQNEFSAVKKCVILK